MCRCYEHCQSPGKELAGGTNSTSHCQQVPVLQMGGLEYMWFFSLLLWDSNQCPLDFKPKTLSVEPPGHTHTHTHTRKSKASRCLLQVTRSWTSQGTCALSRYDVPVLWALLESGQGTRRRYQPCLPLPVWAPCSPTTTISGTMRHSWCALLPQYKTRYPFYRWVGWWAGVLVMFLLFFFPPALGFEPVSSSVLWVINPGLYQLNHQGTHAHTHTHARTHTHTHTWNRPHLLADTEQDQTAHCSLLQGTMCSSRLLV